jgi:putative Holliday junction resolvase
MSGSDRSVQPDSAGNEFPRNGRIMGVDWGEKRIGLAMSDPTQTISHPLATLTRRLGKRFPMRDFRKHLEEHDIVAVVVGLPLDQHGKESPASKAARAMAEQIQQHTDLPLGFQDERFSTARALAAIREMGGSTRGREGEVDQLSASLLLQAFLDRTRT